MSKGGIYNGPPREGARGGRDQFNWDNVKSDKDREFYLGHSVKALAGRWQKGKDVYWYTREKDAQGSALEDEIRAVKQREEDAMMEALGFKPKPPKPLAPAALNEKELAQLLKRGGAEAEQVAPGGQAVGVPGVDGGDKTAGLGFAARAANGNLISPKSGGMEVGGTLAGVGMGTVPAPAGLPAALPGPPAALPGPPPLNTSAAMLAMARSGVKLTSSQKKLLSGADRKAAKKARKAAKKAKKAAKKAAKRKHKSRSSSSSGSSSSSDSEDEPARAAPKERLEKERPQCPDPRQQERERERGRERPGRDEDAAHRRAASGAEEARGPAPRRQRHDSPEDGRRQVRQQEPDGHHREGHDREQQRERGDQERGEGGRERDEGRGRAAARRHDSRSPEREHPEERGHARHADSRSRSRSRDRGRAGEAGRRRH